MSNINSNSQKAKGLVNILVIIPVRNEEATIINVINSLHDLGLQKIRIIDNGSSDRSATLAEKAGVEVISEPIVGYGQACWTGLQNLPPEIEWILFCDGDGSDDITQLEEFWPKQKTYDLILGDRTATVKGCQVMTPVQKFGNRLASFLIQLGWGYSYHDLGPLRLIRRSALESFSMEDRGFGWTVEMQVKAVQSNLNICEIPVNYYPRKGGKSKISGTISGSIKAGIIILTTLGNLYLRDKLNFNSSKFLLFFSSIFLLLGTILIIPNGDFLKIETVPPFLQGIGIMGLGFFLSWGITNLSKVWFWTVTILTRLLLLPMYPGDDIWRYLWEGYLQTLGISPYHFAPDAVELIPYRTEWWSLINHLDTSAIYPPIAQWGFRFLATISPSVMIFKLGFIVADLFICWLLARRFGERRTLLYAWNPLVIYSFAGGSHYDSWFILPLVISWLIFDSNHNHDFSWRWVSSGVFVGISIAVKWISLPILGFLVYQAFRRINFLFASLVLMSGLLPLVLSAIPFCSLEECPLIPTSSNFVSYGKSAEFFPYLLALVWQNSHQWNWIYAIPLVIAIIWLLTQTRTFRQFSLGYFFFLYIVSPVIHAWYFTWIIPFAVVNQNLGVRLISLSSFIYFVLQYRQALGDTSWFLNSQERLVLWLPFILGYLWTIWQKKV